MSKLENPLIPPTIEDSKVVFDEFIKVRRDILRLPSAHRYNYYSVITKEEAVVILPVTPEGLFVLNEEYRHPTKQILLGSPGGYLEKDEDPLVGGAREMREETGYSQGEMSLMGSAYPYPGISGQKIFYVLARNVISVGDPHLDDSEILRTVVISPEDLKKKIREGALLDGTLCTALYFFSLL